MNIYFKQIVLLLCATFCFTMAHAQLENVNLKIVGGCSDKAYVATVEAQASKLLSSFNYAIIKDNRKPKLKTEDFSKGIIASVMDLWNSSAMSCPVSSVSEKLVAMNGGHYQVRNIPIDMLAADDDDQEQELVLEFDAKGALYDVRVAMEQHRYMNIIASNKSVEDLTRRQIIVDFVENFRTSYNRKDIEYLKQVFSDNALIITGKVLKNKENSDQIYTSMGAERIVYQQQTKGEYIEKMKKIFAKNKYINIKFDDIAVMRHPKYDNIFGVTLKQFWNTSTYSDVGYVFLMIDFTDDNAPCIQVRTWQPEKFNGKELSRDEVFSLDNFNL